MSEKPVILVVDDELSIRESFKLVLSDKYSIITAASGEAAVKRAADDNPDLAFLDIRMPGMDGLETLKKIRDINPDLMVVMVTAVNEVQKASEAIRLGAQDYIVKPFDVNQVLKLASDLIMKKRILEEGRRAGRQSEQLALIGSSEKIERARKLAEDATEASGGVLIVGPEGTEREAVARIISVEQMVDARDPSFQLFGKSGGATVADLKRIPGAIDLQSEQSVFIDHAEKLTPWAQEKLAEYRGRVVFGTSRDLKEENFNPRLLEQCSETIIELPPLSERASDIQQLLDHSLGMANLRNFRDIKGFSAEALNLLASYNWPGNTAQLNAVVANLVLLAGDKKLIEPDDLPLEIRMNEMSLNPAPLEDLYARLEKEHISEVLKETGQNREKAAMILGISQKLLESRI
ncbi:MAG TPA: response regulator [Candidatus Omnitrophota bacterium]|nr:response regulator [Candidatus Omnitrophota bacterium]